MLRSESDKWTVADSERLYAIKRWGDGFFRAATDGNIQVRANPRCPHDGHPRDVSLLDLVDRLQLSGADLPLLIRFNDIIESRMLHIRDAFSQAMEDTAYHGDYRGVFPIKVNQQKHVVERILDCGRKIGFGLEAGSKPELLAVLAIADDETPIICNGFKDANFIETVVLAEKMGRQITTVIERHTELDLLLHYAKKHGVAPTVGMRVKLAARGSGRWQASGGYRSKFGLTVGEILSALDRLKREGMNDCFQLLHFHLGSQVTDIRHIKAALIETSRVYAHLVEKGANLKTIDVGGGLGVDYDGSQSDSDSSVNYSLQEYANDVVYYIQQVCDDHKVAHPDIMSESGRAVVAHHSVLVLNVLGVASQVVSEPPSATIEPSDPQPLRILQTSLDEVNASNVVESYHDGQQALDMAMTLFGVGHLTMAQRATAEQQFWRLCGRIREILDETDDKPAEVDEINELLTDTYFCNFSLFQSLPDSWAIKQVFPVAPIHRLDERPTRRGVLGDITCDSDGKIENFIGSATSQSGLRLHTFVDGEPYYLGLFLVGAYQETLGDLHNLFGDTNAAHVSIDENGEPHIDAIIKGDTVSEVLSYVQFSPKELQEKIKMAIGAAIRNERLDRAAGTQLLNLYSQGLRGYTYLVESDELAAEDGMSKE